MKTNTRDSIALLKEQIQQIQYDLLMRTPQLQHQSLTHHLCFQSYLSDDKKLLTTLPISSLTHKKLSIKVNSPNLYIQKLRSIYYLLLSQTYEKNNPLFMKAFFIICLKFYTKSHIKAVQKKLLAQFLQFINFQGMKVGIIKLNINKYPIIDQILIDMLIDQIQTSEQENNLGRLSPDDNYNIIRFLSQLGIKAQARTLWELRIDSFEIRVSCQSFIVTFLQNLKEKVHDQEILSTGEDQEEVQSSNVFQFCDNVFDKMDKSYIQMLRSFIKEDEEKQKKTTFMKNNYKAVLQSLKEPLIERPLQFNAKNIENTNYYNKKMFFKNQKLIKEPQKTKKPQIPAVMMKESIPIEPKLHQISSGLTPILKYKSNLKITSSNQKILPLTPVNDRKIKPTINTARSLKAINFVY